MQAPDTAAKECGLVDATPTVWDAGGTRKIRPVQRKRAVVSAPESPAHLQFRLRYFVEHLSTDNLVQGAGDEVFVSAIGLDSAAVVVGSDRKPAATPINSERIGDVSEDAVRNPWRTTPHALLGFGPKSAKWMATQLLCDHLDRRARQR